MAEQQFTENLKKVVEAGLGAVATGVEKAADAVEDLSKKGEPIYEQAKEKVTDFAGKAWSTVSDAADKFVKAIGDVFTDDNDEKKAEKASDAVSTVIDLMQKMNKTELNQIRCALEAIYPTRPED